MSGHNRVAWQEGMFLRAQHFQAQDRYHEAFLSARHDQALPYSWGFSELSLDTNLAELGRIAIKSAKGIMPDGTPFSIPGDQPAPSPIEVSASTRDSIVYLTLPPQQSGAKEFDDHESGAVDARFLVTETALKDNYSDDPTKEDIALGAPNLRIGLTADEIDGRFALGLGRIREVSSKKILFDDSYIPPFIDIAKSSLGGVVADITGRCDQMVEQLALQATESTEGGQDTYRAFLLLQALNRWNAILGHLGSMPAIHPERLFENLLGMAGEVSTLTRKERRPPELPRYDHEDLQGCFSPVVSLLQQLLSGELDRSTEVLELREFGPGQYLHVIANAGLLKSSYVYLAVSCKSKSLEEIRARFPSVCKIGPNTKMKELVRAATAGVRLRHTTTPPSQLRILPGYVYFELDRSSQYWTDVLSAPGLGLFVAGEWPGLKLELWAVKQKT